jgi:hypothetical protein
MKGSIVHSWYAMPLELVGSEWRDGSQVCGWKGVSLSPDLGLGPSLLISCGLRLVVFRILGVAAIGKEETGKR